MHSRRLTFYGTGLENVEVDPILLRYAEHTETTYHDAKDLRDIRKFDKGLELLVVWEGLPDHVDQTWEPLAQIANDLPGMLHDFLDTAGKRDLKKEALRLSNFE